MYVSSRDSQCILVITLYEQLHIEHTLSLLLVYDNAYNGLKLILKKPTTIKLRFVMLFIV